MISNIVSMYVLYYTQIQIWMIQKLRVRLHEFYCNFNFSKSNGIELHPLKCWITSVQNDKNQGVVIKPSIWYSNTCIQQTWLLSVSYAWARKFYMIYLTLFSLFLNRYMPTSFKQVVDTDWLYNSIFATKGTRSQSTMSSSKVLQVWNRFSFSYQLSSCFCLVFSLTMQTWWENEELL